MSNTPKSSSAIPGFIIGVVLMVGGMMLSKMLTENPPAFLETLAHQGISLDPGKTIAVIGVFLILFPIIRGFFITPLAEAINARTSELEGTFAQAEELRTEMSSMRNEYEKRLAATEAQARETIQAQIKEAQTLRTTLVAEASAKADEMVRKAQEEIEHSKHKVITEVRLEVVNLTLGATERILGENVSNDTNKRLIQEFIDKVEVPG